MLFVKLELIVKTKQVLLLKNKVLSWYFSNVDAEVCDTCGEAYFSSDTAKELQLKAAKEFKKGNEIELVKL